MRIFFNIDPVVRIFSNIDSVVRIFFNIDPVVRKFSNIDSVVRIFSNIDPVVRNFSNIDSVVRNFSNIDPVVRMLLLKFWSIVWSSAVLVFAKVKSCGLFPLGWRVVRFWFLLKSNLAVFFIPWDGVVRFWFLLKSNLAVFFIHWDGVVRFCFLLKSNLAVFFIPWDGVVRFFQCTYFVWKYIRLLIWEIHNIPSFTNLQGKSHAVFKIHTTIPTKWHMRKFKMLFVEPSHFFL